MGNTPMKMHETPKNECTLCLIQHSHATAFAYCIECQVLLCEGCVDYHRKLDLTKPHGLIYQLEEEIGKGVPDYPHVGCQRHAGKSVDRYCPKHEDIGCHKCMEETHKSCKRIAHIPKSKEEIATTKEMTRVKEDIKAMKKTLELFRNRRKEDRTRLDSERQNIISIIEELKQRVTRIVESVELTSKQVCENNYKECMAKIETDLSTCSELLKILDMMTKSINEEQDNTLLFLEMKKAKQAIAVGVTLLNNIVHNVGTERLTFTVDPTVEQLLGNITSFGHINEGKYSAVLTGTHDVSMSTDSERSNFMLYGTAVLQDGRVVVSDVSNGKLKILSPAYKLKSHVQLIGTPCGVCVSGDMEIAVCIFDKCIIQLLGIETPIKRIRQIKTGLRCRGVAAYDNKLFVTCQDANRNELKIITKSGKLLRSVYDDKYGNPIFSNINQIAVSPDGNKIMITDPVKGIVSFSMNGELISVVTSGDIIKPNGIAFKRNGDFFVSGFSSNNVVHFGADGKKIGIVIQERDGLESPMSLCLVDDNCIVITSAESKYIQVYQLKDKL